MIWALGHAWLLAGFCLQNKSMWAGRDVQTGNKLMSGAYNIISFT